MRRGGEDPMEVAERSQSSQEDGGEGDDDIVGRMEIDDADDMAEVADILLRLNVRPPPPTTTQHRPCTVNNTYGFRQSAPWQLRKIS